MRSFVSSDTAYTTAYVLLERFYRTGATRVLNAVCIKKSEGDSIRMAEGQTQIAATRNNSVAPLNVQHIVPAISDSQ